MYKGAMQHAVKQHKQKTKVKNCLRVIGNGSLYTSPCVVLTNKWKSFWFNMPDHYQFLKSKRIPNITALFATSIQWQRSVGGLGYFCNYVSKENTVKVFGPQGNSDFMITTIKQLVSSRRRTWLKNMDFHDIVEPFTYMGDDIQVSMIPIYDANNKKNNPTIAYVTQSFQPYSPIATLLQRNDSCTHYHTDHFVPSKILYRQRIILECPTEGHIRSLTNSDILSAVLCCSDKTPSLIVHITPEKVFQTGEYQKWINSFPDCQHFILNSSNSPGIVNYGSYEQHYKMHKICDYFFPAPQVDEDNLDFDNSLKVMRPPNMLEHFDENQGCHWNDESVLPAQRIHEIVEAKMKNPIEPNERESFLQYKEEFLSKTLKASVYPLIVNLGTSSHEPSYKRSQSCHLIFTNESTSVLLDCGQFALQGLYQHYGKNTKNILSTIKMIFISHQHLDHHAGLASFLQAISELKSKKERVLCLTMNLQLYQNYFEKYAKKVLNCVTFLNMSEFHSINVAKIASYLGVKRLEMPLVQHICLTRGIVLTYNNGYKVAYTADTRPMPKNFMKAAKNADVLIHDCCGGTSVCPNNDIIAKGHSDFEGALKTQRATNAKFLLLTHIRSLETILPICETNLKKGGYTCYPAFDHLSVFSNQYETLPKIHPLLYISFKYDILKYVIRWRKKHH